MDSEVPTGLTPSRVRQAAFPPHESPKFRGVIWHGFFRLCLKPVCERLGTAVCMLDLIIMKSIDFKVIMHL
jgi:hypothetical protein